MSYEAERAIAKAATPGPWKVHPLPDGKFGADWKSIWADVNNPVVMHDSYTRQEFGEAACHHGVEISEADAAHIAAFNPEFCLGLLDKLERYAAALRVWVCRGHREGGVGTHQAGNIDCDLAREALNATKANDD